MATFIELERAGRPLYRVRWNYRPTSIDGRPYDQREFRSKADARKWQRDVEKAEAPARGGRITVARIADTWIEQRVQHMPRRTRDDYIRTVRMRIKPGLGAKVADRVTPGDGNRWMQTMTSTGYAHPALTPGAPRVAATPTSIPTANKTLRTMRAMMRWARGQDLTICRAFSDVPQLADRRPSSERRSRARAYTLDELDLIIESCATMMEATIIRTAAASGLRRSELFALCWDAVDLDEGTVTVVRALDSDGTFKQPKTYEERTVELLTDEAVTDLRTWRQHAPDTDLVFCTVDGRPLHTTWDSGHLPGIRARSGIHVQLGECRDTYASELLATPDVTEVELTLAIGHRDVQTTRNHYLAFLRDRQRQIRGHVRARHAAARASRATA